MEFINNVKYQSRELLPPDWWVHKRVDTPRCGTCRQVRHTKWEKSCVNTCRQRNVDSIARVSLLYAK